MPDSVSFRRANGITASGRFAYTPACTRRPAKTPAGCDAARGVQCHPGLMEFRVLIVDDNGAFLFAARRLLAREGLQIVGMALSAAEALRRVGEVSPDVVLVDVELADESGFDVARQLVEHVPDGPSVILVSTHAEEDLAELIDESPAIGFLPKAALSAPAIRGLLNLAEAVGPTARRGT